MLNISDKLCTVQSSPGRMECDHQVEMSPEKDCCGDWCFNILSQSDLQIHLKGTNIHSIGHFWITFDLFFKASVGAHPFLWKLVFIHMQMKTNFHMKRWAPRLALKKRQKVIQKWPIALFNAVMEEDFCMDLHLCKFWLLTDSYEKSGILRCQ